MQTILNNNRYLLGYQSITALKETCKAVKKAVAPYTTGVLCGGRISELCQITSASVTAGGLWDPSYTTKFSIHGNIDSLETMQSFANLPMPNLKDLVILDVRHPAPLAQANWPQLSNLYLTFEPYGQDGLKHSDTLQLAQLGHANWPLKSLSLNLVKIETDIDISPSLSSFLAGFPGIVDLNLSVKPEHAVSVAQHLASVSLPSLETLNFSAVAGRKFSGRAVDGLPLRLAAAHWPSLRHAQLYGIKLNNLHDAQDLASASWLQRLKTLDFHNFESSGNGNVAALLDAMKGGPLERLTIDIVDQNFTSIASEFRNADLPTLKYLNLSSLVDPGENFISLDGTMHGLFTANLPALEKLHIDPGYEETYDWSNISEVLVSRIGIVLPCLQELKLDNIMISMSVVQFLKQLRQRPCSIYLSESTVVPEVELSLELTELMYEMGLAIDDLDYDLKQRSLMHDFWVWGTFTPAEMKVLVYKALMGKTATVMEDMADLPVQQLKKVVVALETTEEPLLQKLVQENEEWMTRAKQLLETLDRLSSARIN